MKKQMHLAAQYLAAAGISFVPKKEDDSHTNLGFSIADNRMETHELSENGDILCLDYTSFSLLWISKNGTSMVSLDGKTHAEILKWLEEISQASLQKKYSFDLHYELPYKIMNDFRFELTDEEELKNLAQLRKLAHIALKDTLENESLESSIRVWPHHFDSGSFTNLNKDVAVGFGLAIPDEMSDEHYFYISGYKGHNSLDTSDFSKLTKGEWKNNGFKGAILKSDSVDQSTAVQFFKEALENYKTTK